MKGSKIEWTDHTFNPWEGCTKISPGCANCYAEARNKRFTGGKNWGPSAPRRRTSDANWCQPLKWNRDANRDMVERAILSACKVPINRPRVFCASLADWLDDEVPIEWLADLLKLIHETPNLDWLLLTKRPENFFARIDEVWRLASVRKEDALYDFAWAWQTAGGRGGHAPANVWIGTSVEDQVRLDERVPLLLDIPAHIRFLSCEPLLGPLNLRARPARDLCIRCGKGPDAPHDHPDGYRNRGLDWIICGGESGPGARPMHPDWALSLRDQCQSAGVAFFFKQWGEFMPDPLGTCIGQSTGMPAMIRPGKKAAGRILDGREWNDFPKVEGKCLP